MSAELIVKPRFEIGWNEFCVTHPAGSIALDGYVNEEPKYDGSGPFLNANHHEKVNRQVTRSTAEQIKFAIRQGLDKWFAKDGEFSPTVYVNDCDEDVCAAWYLLDHVNETRHSSPALNRFIEVAGTLDVTAGAFPYDSSLKILGELAWVFTPYTDFRANGGLEKNDSDQYRSTIESVCLRIGQHLVGRGDSVKLDTRYEIIGGGKNWKLIQEIGSKGRIGAFRDGITAYIIAREDGDQWRYSVGKTSEYNPFPVQDLLTHYNAIENSQAWGGSDTVGGCLRGEGSTQSPAEIEAATNEYLGRH